jgi:proteasome lid subunit RPN8/RPN11
MKCRISSALLSRLVTEAGRAGENEICGLLLGSQRIIADALAAPNVAGDPRARFEIDPAVHLAASRTARNIGQAIVGCYHSHPNGPAVPSEGDSKHAWQSGFYWLIVAKGDARLWIADTSGGLMRFSPVLLEIETIALQPSSPLANRWPAWA